MFCLASKQKILEMKTIEEVLTADQVVTGTMETLKKKEIRGSRKIYNF